VTAHGTPTGPLQFDRLEGILDRQMCFQNSEDFIKAGSSETSTSF